MPRVSSKSSGRPATLEVFNTLDLTGVDAVLMSGTGMPTLRAMQQLITRVPLLSSNLCLAWALDKAANETELRSATPGSATFASWLARDAAWRGRVDAQR